MKNRHKNFQNIDQKLQISLNDGFTLIELLIVMAVTVIILAAVVGSFDNMSQFFTKENVKSETQKKVRFGLDVMIQDIQLSGLNPHGVIGSGIQAATSTSLQIASDLSLDGDFDDPFETISYSLNGTSIVQTNHLGSEPLVQNVNEFRLTYFDMNGDEIVEPINISIVRSVGLTISVTNPSGRGGTISRSYSTRIRCRNL